ncbi:MAG: hypothetical protein A3B91_02365 [Candidatus Yanofskybacteria bacterium RIFCSPHIGHO2_02_FULL_41_29]|nr:MAG: hypothetical protein A3B91_02365 [Candidatus Yanofskybacteria bacterium RIFCSPHIGHO2_02_FULL_41_29]OGN16856.1 MAG: hypothetical protein A3F48_00060 [Candidatus Yanofskybacteria bacterium RIFCSPHIGHO2_12_FULL_41_9]OGN23234.1 MAG: hypothetical protein A2916_02780 [Candidatus Yanofskybacteria bacterium RIFCSPLOWO2_01_FULL_41_67]OGN28869.1 MAG: hypothetical protein A3H54_01860 [Candidatus Yanofskybacteria bacterium RIFCSPLOWO2_02_FULL_41_13]OGN35780.1 MAG: hypothetical protein A3F98_02485 [
MKKILFFAVIALAMGSFFVFNTNQVGAVKPTDYGLKEGDLISAIFSDDPDVYIINEQGYKRLFLNPEIFKFYSHLGGFANIKLVTPEIRDSFPTSGFFRNCEDNDQKVYGTSVEGEDTGRLHWINKSGDQAVQEDPDFFKKVFCINRKEFNWYPRGTEFKALKEVPRYNRSVEAENPVICHRPPDSPENIQTIRVAPESLDTHFQHGDTKGACLISSEQQSFPVDVKINGSDTPSGVPYDSVFTVSWTSNGAVSCRDFGQFIPTVDGGTWAKFINLPTSGTKSLYARASEGYLATLDIQVQCSNAAGQTSDDVIHLAVQPSTTSIPNIPALPMPVPTTPSVAPVPISIGSPNGGEVYQKGTTQLIKWNSSNISKIYIKLRKGNDTYPGPEGMITDIIPNVGGYYKWWIPTTLPDGNDYAVRIIDGNYTGGFDDSDKQFSIVSSATQTPVPSVFPTPIVSTTPMPTVSPLPGTTSTTPSITVLSPNGGEIWQAGYYYEVKWTNTTGKSVNLELVKGNNAVAGWSSIDFTVSTYIIGLPLPLEAGSDYRIRITTVDTGNVDYSDAPFSIASGTTQTPDLTPKLAPTTQSNFFRNLTLGSTGDDVKQLQALLVSEVGYSANLITGYFGRITRDAVAKFQEKYGIKPTYGYFGEITRKTLGALISGR